MHTLAPTAFAMISLLAIVLAVWQLNRAAAKQPRTDFKNETDDEYWNRQY